MGWQERQYRPPEDEGGFRRALRRITGEGGSFFDWSIPLFRVAGIRVKIHLFFVIYIVVQLIFSMQPDKPGLLFTAMGMATLFTLVLLHEFGHCFACRAVGGEANEILMWPLGGLAMCMPPNTPRANLVTTLGGPAVNLVLMPVFAGVLYLLQAPSDVVLFNPFKPYAGIGALSASSNALLYVKFAIASAHIMNFYLFVFNMLLPMFPMDAGRVVQELLWFRVGYRRSMLFAVNLGLSLALVVGMYALVVARNNSTLFAIAVFAGFTCWNERQRVLLMEDSFPGSYDTSRGYRGMSGGGRTKPERKGPTKAEIKQREEEANTLIEVDRILEKIRTEGMGSLTKREKAVLRGETERKRRQAAGN